MFNKKNICITILLISNSCTLYLLYTTYQETLYCEEKQIYKSLKDNYEDEEGLNLKNPEQAKEHIILKYKDEAAMQEALKEHIISKYKDILPYCGAAISMSERGTIKDTPVHNMACLLAGKRNIIWDTMQAAKNSLTYDFLYELVAFEQAAQGEGIREFEGVSFRPNEERNALLLVKFDLLDQPGLLQDNNYIQGHLLGYPDKDIAFIRQRSAFRKQIDELPPSTYPEFSPEMKKKFDIFVQQTWSKSQQQEFEQDKQEALAWIQEQKHYSIEELRKQIGKLKKAKRKIK